MVLNSKKGKEKAKVPAIINGTGLGLQMNGDARLIFQGEPESVQMRHLGIDRVKDDLHTHTMSSRRSTSSKRSSSAGRRSVDGSIQALPEPLEATGNDGRRQTLKFVFASKRKADEVILPDEGTLGDPNSEGVSRPNGQGDLGRAPRKKRKWLKKGQGGPFTFLTSPRLILGS